MIPLNEKRLVYKSLLALANRLKKHTGSSPPAICSWVSVDTMLSCRTVNRILQPLFTQWPKYSGSIYYPVPAGTPDNDHARMYERARYIWGGFWDRSTQYGANRRELLIFLIHTLLKQIHDEENNQPTFETNL